MGRSKKTNTMRKLEDTSWLAQILRDKMDVEFEKNGGSSRYNALNTFRVIVQEADDPNNETIYYDNYNGKRSIIICEIPSLIEKHGTNFSRYDMECRLLGLAERYKDVDGNYIVSVMHTHDLNSATIKDISELLYSMSQE